MDNKLCNKLNYRNMKCKNAKCVHYGSFCIDLHEKVCNEKSTLKRNRKK